jgi:hypothetical protein
MCTLNFNIELRYNINIGVNNANPGGSDIRKTDMNHGLSPIAILLWHINNKSTKPPNGAVLTETHHRDGRNQNGARARA